MFVMLSVLDPQGSKAVIYIIDSYSFSCSHLYYKAPFKTVSYVFIENRRIETFLSDSDMRHET